MNVTTADRDGLPSVSEGEPRVGRPPEGSIAGRSWHRPSGARLAFWAPSLTTFLLLCLRNRYAFSIAIREEGDLAANSVLIQRAAHFHQLVGEYSRVGFNHPGPAFLYIEAFGQTLFYNVFHIVPSAFDGQLMATFALNALIVGLITWIIYRQTDSPLVAGITYGVILAYTGYHLTFSSPWFPHLFFACFLLFMVAGASIASRDLRDLPTFVLAGGLLAHGHIAFIEFVAVWTVVVGIVWVRRNHSRLRSAASEQRRSITIAAGILGVFLLPLVLNVVLHFPGEWRKYASYLKHNGAHTHSLRAGADYLLSFWAHRPVSGALMALAGLLAVALILREPDRDRRRFFGWLLGAGLTMSVLFLAYAVRGIDDLSQGYIGIFYMAVPLLVLMVAGAAVASALGARATAQENARGTGLAGAAVAGAAVAGAAVAGTGVAGTGVAGTAVAGTAVAGTGVAGTAVAGIGVARSRTARRPGPLGMAVTLVLTGALIVAGVRGRMVTNPYRGQSDLAAAIAAVKAAPQRAGRPVAIQFPHDSWPVAVGFLSNSLRAGMSVCLVDPFWTFMVTADHVCRPAALNGSWQVRFDPLNGPAPAGQVPVWSDTATAITAAP